MAKGKHRNPTQLNMPQKSTATAAKKENDEYAHAEEPVIETRVPPIKAKRKAKKITVGPTIKISEGKPNLQRQSDVKEEKSVSGDALKALSYRISRQFPAARQLFLKRDPTNDSSMIVANVPPFLDETGVGSLISRFASTSLVKSVVFKKSTALNGDIKSGYRQGSVVFTTDSGPNEVLRRCEQETLCLEDISKATTSTGTIKFAKEYNDQFKPVEELREAIKATVSAYDVKVAKERDEAKRKRNQPDEEGWVTVTREDKHSFRPASQKGKVTASDEPPRKKPKSAVPFYSHEAKESKLNHLRDLQQKFEEDKKRLIMARAARKFNPI